MNRFTDERTREFLRNSDGPVWVVEVGAIHFFGSGLRPSIPRQTKAMRYLVNEYPRVSNRLKRLYVYHWRAAPGDTLFDSALLSAEGVPRPAYSVFTARYPPKPTQLPPSEGVRAFSNSTSRSKTPTPRP